MAKRKKAKSVETLTHGEAARRNIPTAECHPVMADEDKAPIRVAYERRNRDLDPQLVWRGKDEWDAADLVVQAPPLYIQEKVHPKVLTGKVAVATMHVAKGLEFRAVAVMACDDEVLPLQSRIENVADEADLEDTYSTERQLLYVACTRARDRLLVTGVEPASEFLDDLQMGD